MQLTKEITTVENLSREVDSKELAKLLLVTTCTINNYSREGMPHEEKVNKEKLGWNKNQQKRYFIIKDCLKWLTENKSKTKAGKKAKVIIEGIN